MKKFISALMILVFCVHGGQSAIAKDEKEPAIVSEAAVLIDSQSKAILYNKNGSDRMYPASLTKIATAIYAIKKGGLDNIVTVSRNAVETEGTKVYLEEGEKTTLRHLIEGMLVNSGNDAAAAIAEHLDGNMEEYEKNVNTFLEKEVHVHNTHFTNPHGLFDERHYTTAEDMALITSYALKDSTFRTIYGTKELAWDGESWDTTIFTHHRMLKGEVPYTGITGGKTGFVNESKQTLATSAENGKIQLTAIVMKADFKRDIYNDTKNLLDYGFSHFKSSMISKETSFQKGDQLYFSGKDRFVTIPLNHFEKIVTEEGLLKIVDDSGKLIQIFPLEPEAVKAAGPSEAAKAAEIKETPLKSGVFYMVFVLILASLYILSRKIYWRIKQRH
ncbi:D-alanyl-D-alanine carboxypeptidase family protein [Bacillus infantis]|jgi:serine-type D-Ala-D-Ala carboxypeptidase (penicillin-binding protein 5/6)|uniref:D-alanyl-D-alanine carboxypeptidase family protein n=1 Tax=Bacillus infantis TaxID=324767 RepID=UPI002155D2E1|nr:D-alanyl-D-alanine carboxypeptidase family protein [Bacillus infantis]MCR6610933.1 D-alanyl-D-alanine carboxypeptidase [Bacillus infantis]